MKPGITLGAAPHLALAPRLQQSVRLLRLSTLELAQEIDTMLQNNPFLEHAPPADPQPDQARPNPREPSSDIEPERFDTWHEDAAAPPNRGHFNDDPSAPDSTAAPIALQDHLHAQARCLRLSEPEHTALYLLIDALDDDGYLIEALPDLAHAWLHLHNQHAAHAASTAPPPTHQRLQQHLSTALHQLQQMGPPGVGARTLSECLCLQLADMRNTPYTRAAWAICHHALDLLARRDFKNLCLRCHIDPATARSACALIARLEPKPGRAFAQVPSQFIVPEVIVSRQGEHLSVSLHTGALPPLHIPPPYAQALHQLPTPASPHEHHALLQQQLQQAQDFIKHLAQRTQTLLLVSRAIVQHQHNFFLHGAQGMRPLVLREIAHELGLHESTISRASRGKYMSSPVGTYELKYFFGSSLRAQTHHAEQSSAHTPAIKNSSIAVRALIQRLIAQESPSAPLSDGDLALRLQALGIACARRTVAKYRQALRIAPAPLRKQP